MRKSVVRFVLGVAIVSGIGTASVYAATTYNSQLTQSITAGSLSTDVRDGSNVIVASPSFAMSSVAASTSAQTATGTFGTATQRISVDNPGGANNGWTLTLNATTPGTGTWTSGGNTYAYNGTSAAGQLTVNPNAGTLVATTGTATSITKGSSASFSGTTPVTLLTAAAGSDDIWSGYITGITLSQTIPAGQPVGTYSINMTQTVAAT